MCRFLLTLGLVTILGAPALAQVRGPLQVDVPFDFSVGKTTLRAGRYLIAAADTATPGAMILQGTDSREIMFLAEESMQPQRVTETQLVFDVVNGTHILCEIWQAGSTEGNVMAECKAQRAQDREHSQHRTHRVVEARLARPDAP